MSAGIPTVTNLDHVCITVPDLDEAMRFFVDVIGAEEVMRDGPYEDAETNWMEEHLRTHPRARLNAGLLRLGPTVTLELYEIDSPRARSEQPRPDDVGAVHLSFHVRDFDRARHYLCERGLTMHGEASIHEGGQLAGTRWQHFESPWGLVLEIVSWPEKMPYEERIEARLAAPQPSWDLRA